MKRSGAKLVLMMFGLFAPVAAQACRIPPRPEALKALEADAIILTRITALEVDGEMWRATAEPKGVLMGSAPERAFSYGNGYSPDEIVISCDQSWRPKLDRYEILYMRRTSAGMRVHRGYPYWWAKASGDPRLAGLSRLLPLGPVREPTADEIGLLNLAEPRIELPEDAADLSGYARIYVRSSPTWLNGVLFRSRTPRRLMVDNTSELPTEDSCGCTLISIFLQLDDLARAGLLPPFKP